MKFKLPSRGVGEEAESAINYLGWRGPLSGGRLETKNDRNSQNYRAVSTAIYRVGEHRPTGSKCAHYPFALGLFRRKKLRLEEQCLRLVFFSEDFNEMFFCCLLTGSSASLLGSKIDAHVTTSSEQIRLR